MTNRKTVKAKNDALQNAIGALPFVRDTREGRCFWAVSPTGNYSADIDHGKAWAEEFRPLLRYNVGRAMVAWIVADMIAIGTKNGLVIGFMSGVADLAVVGDFVLTTAATAAKEEKAA